MKFEPLRLGLVLTASLYTAIILALLLTWPVQTLAVTVGIILALLGVGTWEARSIGRAVDTAERCVCERNRSAAR